jgi:lipopolysaccharide transport system permease protein
MRYRDSLLGLSWAIVSPLILALLYAVIYSTVFEAKWFVTPDREENYALVLYTGLVLFLLFADVMNTAVTVIENNAVLVKRTTMTTILVPLAASASALISFLFSLVPLVLLYVVLKGFPPVSILLFPVVVLVAWTITIGLGLLISSVAPYFRDMRQFIPLVTTSLLFLSPIFYQVSSLPDDLATALYVVNPLMVLIPSAQDLLFVGRIPPVLPLLVWFVIGLALVAIGRWLFKKTSVGFSDVV